MELQKILVYIALAIAIGFLIKKFFWKKTRAKGKQNGAKSNKDCGDNDCGCN